MNSIKKNFIYNSLYQVLIMFIPLFTTPYLSRILGPSGIGTFSYAYSIASYFVLFIMLGLNNYGNRTIAEVRDNQDHLRTTFWSIYFMQFIIGIFVNLAYLIYCIVLSNNLIISLSMSIFVLSASFDINWCFFGLEKFRLIVVRNSLIKIITMVSIFIFVKEKNDVIIYCYIMVIGVFLSQIILWPYIFKNLKLYKPKLNEIAQHIKPNLFLFLTVIAVSLYKIMDKIMLGFLTSAEQVGFYESSEKIINIPIALVTSLGTVMLPRMTNMISNNIGKNNQIIYYSILFSMFFSTSMCFGIMGVSKEFVPFFYGEGYDTCVSLFIILLPSCIFLAFANVIRTQYILPYQLDNIYVVSAFLGAGVNLLLNILLIPKYQSIGASIGTLAAEIVVCFYQCYKVKNAIPINKYIYKSIPFILSGFFMFIILYNITFNQQNIFSSLFVKICLGIILYFVLLLLQYLAIKIIKKQNPKTFYKL